MRRVGRSSDFLRAAWPAFLVAALASGLLIALFDPARAPLPSALAGWHPRAIDSLLFLSLWLACWAAGALSLWLFARRPAGAGDVFEERDEERDDAVE